ncbi:S1C family serine protease [Paenisporosarcina indica]|uniref:S1C family serine protease n=1 Tax=Paenisporosarcina indica TaxID=650093 RepID=UPI00094F972D|nr:serine protease [Paenisporosarcina indica]
MFCGRCGWKNKQHASYCLDCGLKLHETQDKSDKKLRYLIISCSVVLLSIMGVAYSSFSSSFTLPKEGFVSASGNTDMSTNDKTDLIKETLPRVYTVSIDDRMGSAFLFDDKGSVVTSAHLVAGFTDVWLTDYTGRITTGRVIGISEEYNVALLEVVEYAGKTPLKLDRELSRIGTKVIAFGSPLGWNNTASIGYLTGIDRDFDAGYHYEDIYQFDAQTSPGSSGGPLLDADTGKVIGINTAFLTEDNSIGFSIPSKNMYAQLEQWASSPMPREEVAKVKPYEDILDDSFEFDYGGNYTFDEVTLKDFAEDYLELYEMAVEFGDFFYIENLLKPVSKANEELMAHISEFKGKEMRFDFISGKALNVLIENNQAIVSVSEEFKLVETNGETTSINRERDYTIEMDRYGNYLITDFSLYD